MDYPLHAGSSQAGTHHLNALQAVADGDPNASGHFDRALSQSRAHPAQYMEIFLDSAAEQAEILASPGVITPEANVALNGLVATMDRYALSLAERLKRDADLYDRGYFSDRHINRLHHRRADAALHIGLVASSHAALFTREPAYRRARARRLARADEEYHLAHKEFGRSGDIAGQYTTALLRAQNAQLAGRDKLAGQFRQTAFWDGVRATLARQIGVGEAIRAYRQGSAAMSNREAARAASLRPLTTLLQRAPYITTQHRARAS